MMKQLTIGILLATLAACGGSGDDGDNNQPDANQPPGDASIDAMVDAPPATVQTVDCAGATIAEMVMTVENPRAFSPNAITIQANEIVQFTTGAAHNVIPRAGMASDPGLTVGFGETKCLRFTAAGAFNYRCQPHADMTGVVTVQ